MMRILLFLATNFAVMLVLGIILNVTGIAGNSTGGILIMAMLFGFAGSLISLFLSKTMALRSVGAEVITEPLVGRNGTPSSAASRHPDARCRDLSFQ